MTAPPPRLLAGEDLPPEPRQRRSREKRARLEAAALALFARKGYDGTSVEEIAGRARLAVGGFYLHYRSKRQLLLALMDGLLQALSAVELSLGAGGDARGALRSMLGRAFAADRRFLGAYRAWQEAVLTDAELARTEEAIHAWTTARVQGALERMARLPGARRGVDFAELARVLDAFFWCLIARAVRAPADELETLVDAATHLVYHAMFADAPPARSRQRRGKRV